MPDPATLSVSKLSFPIGMVTTIIGGAAWLSTMHTQVQFISNRFEIVEREFKAFKDTTTHKQQIQGEMISRMDAKLDLMLKQLQIIERRINNNHSHK